MGHQVKLVENIWNVIKATTWLEFVKLKILILNIVNSMVLFNIKPLEYIVVLELNIMECISVMYGVVIGKRPTVGRVLNVMVLMKILEVKQCLVAVNQQDF